MSKNRSHDRQQSTAMVLPSGRNATLLAKRGTPNCHHSTLAPDDTSATSIVPLDPLCEPLKRRLLSGENASELGRPSNGTEMVRIFLPVMESQRIMPLPSWPLALSHLPALANRAPLGENVTVSA